MLPVKPGAKLPGQMGSIWAESVDTQKNIILHNIIYVNDSVHGHKHRSVMISYFKLPADKDFCKNLLLPLLFS